MNHIYLLFEEFLYIFGLCFNIILVSVSFSLNVFDVLKQSSFTSVAIGEEKTCVFHFEVTFTSSYLTDIDYFGNGMEYFLYCTFLRNKKNVSQTTLWHFFEK